uniref:Uncharacterized protein n=1 Tax=Amphimedon queenslandica TaxID=400682 RepID=A0A1X7SSW0_AMPQE
MRNWKKIALFVLEILAILSVAVYFFGDNFAEAIPNNDSVKYVSGGLIGTAFVLLYIFNFIH